MFCRFWGVSACACNFLLRNSRYEFSRENQYPRGWSSEKQLCSVDFEVYLRARATFFSETADLVKTAVFWRFWGVSTCSCNFLLRNSRLTSSRGGIPFREDDLVNTAMFRWFWGVSTCSCNFHLRSSGFSTSRGRIPIREDDLVRNSYVLSILRCICVRVQLSSQKQRI